MKLFIAASLAASTITAALDFQTHFYNNTLDHFHPEKHDTFSHRFLLNDDYFDGRGELFEGCRGPILLYTGNEGNIEDFWAANGFMTDFLAPKYGGKFYPRRSLCC